MTPRYVSSICRGFSFAKCAKHTMRMSWRASKRILTGLDVYSRGNLLTICYSSSAVARVSCRPERRARLKGPSSKMASARLREQHVKDRSAITTLPIRAKRLARRLLSSYSRSFKGCPDEIGTSRLGRVLSKMRGLEDRAMLQQLGSQAAV